MASGIVNVSTQVSAAVGLAVLGTLSSNRTASLLAEGRTPLDALAGGCRLGLLIGAGCVAFGLLLAVTVLRAPRPCGKPQASQPSRPTNPPCPSSRYPHHDVQIEISLHVGHQKIPGTQEFLTLSGVSSR
ncbi:hypothetical protein [Candidatus Protofrankia californiensis]|uniref:hypothetical protein n=1 Tax=Candidatus Protofrankia californiensis TaxID=1839754 RepID=UPI0010413E78|nr:hypothetical protein [Candidatus Protofrankia californiensis]